MLATTLARSIRRRVLGEADPDKLEHDLIPRWERAITQLGWRQVPAGQEMQRDELVHYAQTRRDALQAMVQGFETRQPLWFERSRSLQLQADNILLQMRLRRSLEAAGR